MSHIFAKKSLGQNFLHAPNVVAAIVHTGKISPNDNVLEIGPGKGVLTTALLETGAHVTAVEKDDDLVPFLTDKFADAVKSSQLSLIHGDILETSLQSIGIVGPYIIIANIPYYITGEIIRRFLEEENPPLRMVLMVQKEVAERIVARDGKESILSIAVKAYGIPHFVQKVRAECFRPVPNVDSAVLLVESISKNFFKQHQIGEKQFFEVVCAGFAHKRKFLANNLELLLPKPLILEIFAAIDLSAKTRAESLAPETWGKLTQKIGEKIASSTK